MEIEQRLETTVSNVKKEIFETVGLFALGLSFVVLMVCLGVLMAAWLYG